MAKILKGKCADCNYTTGKLYAGPLMRDFKDRVPALNLESNEVITLIKEEGPVNKMIIPYTDERLKRKPPGEAKGTSTENRDNNNYCPNCSAFALAFEFCGFAD